MLAGQVQLSRLTRDAHVVRDADWALLLSEACERLRLRRPVTLLQSADNPMPLTWGWWRPVVLLPAEAAHWPTRAAPDRAVARTRPREALGLPDPDRRADCLRPLLDQSAGLARRAENVRRTRAGLRRPGPEQRLPGIRLRHAPGGHRPNLPPHAAVGRHRDGSLAPTPRAHRRHRGCLARAAVAAAHGPGHPGPHGRARSVCRRQQPGRLPQPSRRTPRSAKQQFARLESFAQAKEKQSEELAAKAGEKITPEFQRFFDAAIKGDWRTVTNRFEYYKQHHPQYEQGNQCRR